MTWAVLIALVGGAIAALALLGVRGRWLFVSVAALLAAGMAFAVAGKPRVELVEVGRPVVPLSGARHAFYGNFSAAERWLVLSEGLARGGHTRDAVGIVQNAVKRYPGDPQLWVGLGNALVDHADGLTPPAEFAFQRAAELSPGYPAPKFFRGLALARSGRRAEALALWREVLADAPASVSWRPLVEQGIALLSAPNP